MPPAVAAAGIVAAGTIGGAVLGGSAQKKAASQANASQQEATQAQLQLGRESMDLNRDIYNSNYATLSPFVSRGNVAGQYYNALLGLPSAPTMTSPLATPAGTGAGTGGGAQHNPAYTQQPVPGSTGHGGFLDGIINTARLAAGRNDLALPVIGPQALGNRVPGTTTGATGGTSATPTAQGGTGTQAPAATGTQPVSPVTASDALNTFANSAGMQFQLEQGANALNNLYAGHGQLQSGAAMKALQGYGQQTALQNYFMPYMSMLGGQQSLGAQSASSIAGVGSNFGNTAANINNAMGANIQNGANAASNAALAKGAANANMYAGIGQGLGSFASSFFPVK